MRSTNTLTKIKNSWFIWLMLLLLPLLSACGKTSSTATNSGYTYSNGVCYDSSGQSVNASYCSSQTTTSSGYYYSNGYCYNSAGQIVDTSYCSGTNSGDSGTGGNPIANQCYGSFMTTAGAYIQCYGNNCSGMVLYNYSSGVLVYCP